MDVSTASRVNRSDFIRTAIRGQLDKHSLEIQQSVTRHSYVIGVLFYNKTDFEKVQSRGEKIKMTVVGMLHLDHDIPAGLAQEVVESVQVRGIFHASQGMASLRSYETGCTGGVKHLSQPSSRYVR